MARARNRRAADETIAAMRRAGRIEPADALHVAIVRTLADALDVCDPTDVPGQVAQLARAQLAALRALKGTADDGDREFAQFLADVSAPLGDAADT